MPDPVPEEKLPDPLPESVEYWRAMRDVPLPGY